MEYFDVLDENGNKTGKTKLRSEVHRDGDWHKEVHIFIINDNNEILLQRRSAVKDSYPNLWTTSVSGHPSAGDNSIDAAIREIEEEIGLNVAKEDLKYLFTVKENRIQGNIINNQFSDVFLINKNINIKDLKLQEEEVSEVKFFTYEEFKNMVDTDDKNLVPHKEMDNRLLKILGKI